MSIRIYGVILFPGDEIMNYRKYHKDRQELLAQGRQIVKTDRDKHFRHKVGIVNLVLSGMKVSEVAQSVEESARTITRWVKNVDEQGFDVLREDRSKCGRPTAITEDIAQKLDIALQDDPHEYGFTVWDGRTLSAFLKREFGIVLSVRSCQRLFHDLGYSLIRVQTFPSKGNENDPNRGAFKKNCRSWQRTQTQ